MPFPTCYSNVQTSGKFIYAVKLLVYAHMKTGIVSCKNVYVKVMFIDRCCPELTLSSFVELGPMVG